MSEKKNIVEEMMEQNEQMAEGYFKKYRKQCEALDKSLLGKVESIGSHHYVQLGKQLDMFETYRKICEVNGTLNNLGQLPKIAFDVIPAVMGQLPIGVIASVQAIESQKGFVHFKNVVSRTTKGNVTDGEVLVDPRSGEKPIQGLSSNKMIETVATGDGTERDFTTILTAKPSRAQFLKIVANGQVIGEDVGPAYQGAQSIGRVFGMGVSGTVNYMTGELILHFAAAPANAAVVKAEYQQNLELADDLPKIESFWDSKPIEAHVYALKSTMGMLQSFTLQKQYGESALEEQTKDLVRAINNEIFGDLLSKLVGSAQGSMTFYRKGGSGVSAFEQKMTYLDRLEDANANMVGNAGRGTISVMVVGRSHAATVASIQGFEKLSDGKSLGAHIYGKLNGVTYIRVPVDGQIGGAYKGIGIYKGDSPFDAAAVYSPFMPLAMTNDLPEMKNPLVTQKAAATMAGVEVLVDKYVTSFDVSPAAEPA